MNLLIVAATLALGAWIVAGGHPTLEIIVLFFGLALLLGVPAAYAFARFRFRGGEDIAFTLLSFRFAPPLLVHGFRNAGDGELRYLNFHAPSAGFADYLRGRNPDFDQWDPPEDGGLPVTDAVVVPPGTGGVLIDRDEIRIEVRDEPGSASNRLTCLYALEDGRFLEIQA